MKKTLSILGLVSVFAGVIYTLYTDTESSRETASSETVKSLQQSNTPLSTHLDITYPVRCNRAAGYEYSYAYQAKGRIQTTSIQSAAAFADVSVVANLHLFCMKVIDEKSSHYSWYAHFSDLTVEQENQDGLEFEESFLKKPLFFETSKNLGIHNISHVNTPHKPNLHLLRDILRPLSFKWTPLPQSPLAWKSQEITNAGNQVFQFKLSQKPTYSELTKSVRDPKQGFRFTGSFTFNRQSHKLVSVKNSSSQKLKLNQDMTVENETSVSINYLGLSKQTPSKLPQNYSLSKWLHADQESLEKNIYRNELGKDNAATLLEKLFTIQSETEATQYFKKYKSLFVLEEQSISLYEDALIDLQHDDDRFQILTLAMVKAGGDHIQNFLSENILNNPKISQEKLQTILGIMGLLKNPRRETIESVKQIANTSPNTPTQRTAWLAVGNMGKSITSVEPEYAKTIAKELRSAIQKTDKLDEKINRINAAGNLGHASLYKEIKTNLYSSDKTLQKASLSALRYLPADLAQPLLIDFVDDQIEPALQRAAMHSLSFQDFSLETFSRLVSVAKDSKIEDMRLSALQLLRRKFDDAPNLVRRTLEDAARSDSSLRVRQYAESLTLWL